MTTNIGSLAVSLSLDASRFNGSISQVDRNLRAMGSELRAVQARGAEYGNSLEGLRSKQDILRRSVEAAEIKLRETRKAYDELKASGTANEAQLERQANKVNQAQAQYNRLQAELKEVEEALKKQSSSWYQLSQRLEPVGTTLTRIGDGAKAVGRNLSTYVTAPIVGAGAAAFKASVDFETAFAGVRKTVDATEEEFASLSQGIRQMAKEIPAAATEIAGVAEAAGQLGIKTEHIMSFTRTMVDLGVATNMTSEQAATALARLANITQMPQEQFDRLGATIVELGNNLATTESEIVEMGLRIAGAGAQVGLTEAQILSFAGALSSVGIEAEAGGSAFSRVMIEIANASAHGLDAIKDFADVAGMSARDFKELFEKDAAGAIIAFVEGLDRMSKSGENVFGILEGLGLSEIRVRDALLRAAGAGDLFRESIQLGTVAWDENIALTKEAEERYKTTASQIKILWNEVKDLGIEIGGQLIPIVRDGIETIKPWIQTFAEADEKTQKMILTIGGLVAAAGPLLVVGGSLMSGIGGLVTTVGALSGAIAGAGGLSAALGTVAAVGGPITLAVAGIGALTAGGIALAKHLKQDAIPEIDRFGDSVSDATREALDGYFELSDGASQSLMELKITQQAVTEEMKNTLLEQFDQMSEQVITKMQERHNQQLESAREYFSQSVALTSEEEAKILAEIERSNQQKEEIHQHHADRVKEILENAAAENRQLTEHEQEVINNIQRIMNENAVKYLSENEIEAKVILERMKQTAEDLTAQQAAEVVKNSNEQKEKAIQAAEEQYNQTIAEIIRMRDEAGIISEEQADKLIREAKKQRDESVKLAEDMHQKVVSEAQKQAGEHINTVDWETGEILSKWEVFKNNASKKWDETWQKASETWENIKTSTVTKAKELAEGAQEELEKLWDYIKGIPSQALQWGKDIMQGLADGISSMASAVWEKTKNIASGITGTITSTLDMNSPSKVTYQLGKWTGEGLLNGLESTVSQVETVAQKLSQASIPIFHQDINYPQHVDNSRTYQPKMTIIVQSPNPSASEIARKVKQTARQLALEW